MKVASLADVKARFSAYVDELPVNGPVVITRNGKTAAVLLAPVDDDDLERLLLERSPQLQNLLNESRQSIKAKRGVPEAEFWDKVASQRRKKPHRVRGRTRKK